MKKILSVIVSLLIAIIPFAGCNSVNTAELSLNKDTITLSMFGETELTVKSNNIPELSWENSDENVIRIAEKSNSVKLTAVGSGTATVTVSGGGLSASCVVVVAKTDQQLALYVNGYDNVELRCGGKGYIPAEVYFNGAKFDKATVSYSSDDPTVASVDENGEISALAVGETTITVSAQYYGNRSNQRKIAVSVKSGPLVRLNAAFLSLYAAGSEDDVSIFPDEFELDVAMIDGETVLQDVDYEVQISDPAVAKLENGVIKALKVGETQITLSCSYLDTEYTASVCIKVNEVPVVSLSLLESSIVLYDYAPKEGYKTQSQLTAVGTLSGRTIASTDIYWTIEEEKGIVSVNGKGVVKSLSKGHTVVAANYDFAGKTYKAFCDVRVYSPLSYVESHDFYDRAGVYTTIYQGSKFVYDEITLANDRNTPFLRFNLIPDKLPKANEPNDNSSISNKMLRMIYITLTEKGNESNYVIVGVRISYDAAMNNACIGARASTFPLHIEGSGGRDKKPFFGIFNGSNTHTEAGFSIDESRGLGGYFSFYGKYLNDTSDKYTVGFAIEGTAVYLHNNGNITKIWDLDSDTRAYAAVNASPLKESNAWGGFTSDKVKLTVHGDYWYDNHFNIMILDVAGHTATAADLSAMSIE